jgi:hypothetical protein
MAKSMKTSVLRKVIDLTKKKKKNPNDLIVGFYFNSIMRFPRLGFTGRVTSCK